MERLIRVEVNVWDVVLGLTQGESMKVVKEIDRDMSNYAWTLELTRYLVAELKQDCIDNGEVFDMGLLEEGSK
jgi:hypothetical protein